MKINSIYLSVAVLLTVAFSSCSKKTIVSQDNEKYKEYSRQLEMDYAYNPAEQTLNLPSVEPIIENSKAKDDFSLLSAEASIKVNKKTEKGFDSKKFDKVLNSKLLNNYVTKKVERAFDKKVEKSGQAMDGNVRTGIIVGAVGLILLIVAAAIASPASTIIYVGGAILFVVGVILILLGVL